MLCILQNHKGEFHHMDLCFDTIEQLKKAGFVIREDSEYMCEVAFNGAHTEYTYVDKKSNEVLGKEILTEEEWQSRLHYF